jgi:hypothetical protein
MAQYDGIIGGAPVRENWDFVSMDNYAKDTKELADQAAGIIGQQAKRIRELEHMIWAAAMTAGGRIKVWRGLLAERPGDGDLAYWLCAADDTVQIEAKRRT